MRSTRWVYMNRLPITSILFFCFSLFVSLTTYGQNVKPSSLAPSEESVEVKYDELPEAIVKILKQDKYSLLKVEKIYKVGKRNATRDHHYAIRFKSGAERTDVYFDENGNVIDPQDSDNPRDSKTNNR